MVISNIGVDTKIAKMCSYPLLVQKLRQSLPERIDSSYFTGYFMPRS